MRLRALARDRGLRLNEYGVTKEEQRLAGTTEEEVYATLELPWFPPEIRENQGEFEAAAKSLPRLVEQGDLRGDLHVHLPPDGGTAGLDELRAFAQLRRWEYLGVVIPAGNESPHLLRHLHERNEEVPDLPRLFAVHERSVDEPLPTPSGWDYSVARASSPEPPTASGGSAPLLLAHLPIADAGTDASAERVARWVAFAKRIGAGLEVSPDGAVEGLDSAGVRRAIAAGVPVAIRGMFPELPDPTELSVGLARRGWATSREIANCAGRAELSGVHPEANRPPPRRHPTGPRSGSRAPGGTPP